MKKLADKYGWSVVLLATIFGIESALNIIETVKCWL